LSNPPSHPTIHTFVMFVGGFALPVTAIAYLVRSLVSRAFYQNVCKCVNIDRREHTIQEDAVAERTVRDTRQTARSSFLLAGAVTLALDQRVLEHNEGEHCSHPRHWLEEVWCQQGISHASGQAYARFKPLLRVWRERSCDAVLSSPIKLLNAFTNNECGLRMHVRVREAHRKRLRSESAKHSAVQPG
jgi:hypothetical protein